MSEPTRQEIIKFCLKNKQAAKTDEDKAYWQSLLSAQQDIDWENHPEYKYEEPSNLQEQIDKRCPCFAMPLNECNCEE